MSSDLLFDEEHKEQALFSSTKNAMNIIMKNETPVPEFDFDNKQIITYISKRSTGPQSQ